METCSDRKRDQEEKVLVGGYVLLFCGSSIKLCQLVLTLSTFCLSLACYDFEN